MPEDIQKQVSNSLDVELWEVVSLLTGCWEPNFISSAMGTHPASCYLFRETGSSSLGWSQTLCVAEAALEFPTQPPLPSVGIISMSPPLPVQIVVPSRQVPGIPGILQSPSPKCWD